MQIRPAQPFRSVALSLCTALLCGLGPATGAQASEDPALVEALEQYMYITPYGGSLIFPEQIPAESWQDIVIIDARDAVQYEREHIPGAINIEWRQVVARRHEIPRDHTVVLYCNTGSLSGQAVLALRLLGWDYAKVLQDGLIGWKAAHGDAGLARHVRPPLP